MLPLMSETSVERLAGSRASVGAGKGMGDGRTLPKTRGKETKPACCTAPPTSVEPATRPGRCVEA